MAVLFVCFLSVCVWRLDGRVGGRRRHGSARRLQRVHWLAVGQSYIAADGARAGVGVADAVR